MAIRRIALTERTFSSVRSTQHLPHHSISRYEKATDDEYAGELEEWQAAGALHIAAPKPRSNA
jgi:hypothetical protein